MVMKIELNWIKKGGGGPVCRREGCGCVWRGDARFLMTAVVAALVRGGDVE